MHNRLLTFECFHQIKLKAHSIDNNSALESEPNSNNRIWALFQFQNHAKKSTSAKLQLQLLSKLQLQNLEFTSSSSNSCWKPRFLLTNIISIDQVLGNHPYQQESHSSSLNNWHSESVSQWKESTAMIGLGPIKMKIFGWFWLILQDLLTLNHNFGVECKFLEFHPKWILNIGESVDLRRFMRMKISIKVKVMTVMNVLIKMRMMMMIMRRMIMRRMMMQMGKQWMEHGPKPSESELTPTHCSPLSILTVMIGRDHQNHQINHDDLFRHE